MRKSSLVILTTITALLSSLAFAEAFALEGKKASNCDCKKKKKHRESPYEEFFKI